MKWLKMRKIEKWRADRAQLDLSQFPVTEIATLVPAIYI